MLIRDVAVTRRLLAPLLAAAASKVGQSRVAAAAPAATRPAITQRIFLDLRVITRFDVEVLEDAAVRGRMVFGLYGDAAPLGVAKFVDFVDGTTGQFKARGGGPSYSSSTLDRRQGGLIEGGRIAGLQQTEFAGTLEYEYMSRLLPLRPVLEVNDLRHDRRGLLTRSIFNPGPEFGVTLSRDDALDGAHEVLGELVSDEAQLLDLIQTLPYVTGRSLDAPGSAADTVFSAQKSFFSTLSKTLGDKRAEDRTGQLLRRVEIVSCGRL